jgi:hypothetical protein
LKAVRLQLKSPASRGFIPVFHPDGEMNGLENPEKAFSGNGKRYKCEARIVELEKLLGQAHAEDELLKSLCHDSKKVREERIKPTLGDDSS